MKNLLFICLLTCFTFIAKAQYSVGETPLSDIDAHYIRAYISGSISFTGYAVRIEHGPKAFEGFKALLYLLDKPNGERIYFESEMIALNFLYENGYKIEHLVTTAEGNIASYIMVKME